MLRVWQLGEGVRGSTIAAHDGQLVIAGYRPNGPGKARWYDEASVLARGVTDLVETSARTGQVAMTRATRVPPRLQGMAFTPVREALARLVPDLVRAAARRRPAGRLRARCGGLRDHPGLDLGGERGQRFAVPGSGWCPGAAAAAPRPGRRARRRPGHLRRSEPGLSPRAALLSVSSPEQARALPTLSLGSDQRLPTSPYTQQLLRGSAHGF